LAGSIAFCKPPPSTRSGHLLGCFGGRRCWGGQMEGLCGSQSPTTSKRGTKRSPNASFCFQCSRSESASSVLIFLSEQHAFCHPPAPHHPPPSRGCASSCCSFPSSFPSSSTPSPSCEDSSTSKTPRIRRRRQARWQARWRSCRRINVSHHRTSSPSSS